MEKITRNNFYPRFTYGLLALALVMLPFTRTLTCSIACAILLLFLIDRHGKEKFNFLKNNKLFPPVAIISSIFLVIVLGTIYSQNRSRAFSDWEYKFMFLTLPLCIFTIIDKISTKQFRNLIFLFCAATLSVSLINIVISVIHFIQTKEIQQLFYIHATHLPVGHVTHPSYLSMYACFSWVAACYFLLNKKVETEAGKYILWIGIFIFPIEIFFLESKAGMMTFGVILLVTICMLLNHNRKRVALTVAVILLYIGGTGGVLCYLGKTGQGRLGQALTVVTDTKYRNLYDGTAYRMMIWENAWELSVENFPWGVGNGDVRDALCRDYEVRGQLQLQQNRYNCHNQYLQFFLGMGLPGAGALLLFLFYPFILAIKKRDVLLASLIIIIALNMLVESMLEVHAGADFIALMCVLLTARTSLVRPIAYKKSA